MFCADLQQNLKQPVNLLEHWSFHAPLFGMKLQLLYIFMIVRYYLPQQVNVIILTYANVTAPVPA